MPDRSTTADETVCVELQPEDLASSHNIIEHSKLENELRYQLFESIYSKNIVNWTNDEKLLIIG